MADIKTFAADLKAVREAKNLTLKDISQQTRLNISILENIETGDFTFQPQAYIRAFLKQYINSLDLDMDETLFDYDLARSGKYKPKQTSYPSDEPENTEEIPEPKSSRAKFAEKLKGMVDSPRKVSEEKKVEITIEKPEEKIPENNRIEIEPEEKEEETEEVAESIADVTLNNDSETKEESSEDIRERIRNEIREEVRNEIRQEVKKEIKKEVKEEVKEEVKKEVREEVRKEIPKAPQEIKKEVKADNNIIQKRPEEKYYTAPERRREKKKISFSFLNSPIVRNIFMILFALLVLLGIYSLVNILFLENSKDKPEVIRQNFDDVVKEQEKKILGKRTPEEIQDSIRKAEEELAAVGDSITLKITGLTAGSFYLITDSTNFSKPEKISFEKGDIGVFKAKKIFFISTDNSEALKATVNDIPIKFENKSISKIRISRNGVIK